MLVKSKFKPAWWMRNRHLQTILPRLYPTPCDFSPLDREFELSDGDFVELTWSHSPESIAPNQPIVLVLHGLEGSFDSFYAKRMMNAMHRQGWAAVLMHFRGCGKRPNKQAHSYHSGQTQDVFEFVQHLNRQYPGHLLFAVGFSLGGNVLAKYLGEQAESGLSGGVVISAPLDLSICANAINRGFAKVYQKYLVDKLRRSTSTKINTYVGAFPIDITEAQLRDIATLTEFDERITAPLNGFDNAQDYYRRASANQYLAQCQTPMLIVHAKDDPFMTQAVIPTDNMLSEAVTCEISERGGHVGFISGANPLKPEFWAETRSVQFIQRLIHQQNQRQHEA